MPNSTSPEFLTVKEAASHADRSVKTIRNWIYKGKLPASRKVPGDKLSQYQIRFEDLLGFLGTKVQPDPPRKTSVPEQVEPVGNVHPSPGVEVLTLKHRIEMLEMENAHSRELLEREGRNDSRLEEYSGKLERELEHHREMVAAMEGGLDNLREYKRKYEEEMEKGWWERMLNPPKSVKRLTMNINEE